MFISAYVRKLATLLNQAAHRRGLNRWANWYARLIGVFSRKRDSEITRCPCSDPFYFDDVRASISTFFLPRCEPRENHQNSQINSTSWSKYKIDLNSLGSVCCYLLFLDYNRIFYFVKDDTSKKFRIFNKLSSLSHKYTFIIHLPAGVPTHFQLTCKLNYLLLIH